MSSRSDFLTWLTSQGVAPTRAVLCDEGSGDPVEFYTQVACTPSGSPTWSAPSGFTARTYTNTAYNDQLPGDPSTYMGATQQTVLWARRKRDTTTRNAFHFGNTDTTDQTRFGAYLPFTDNNTYFYRGASGGANITTATGVPTTDIEFWGFVTGPSGTSLWKNGVKIDSNATARSWTLTSTPIYMNKGNVVGGDLVDDLGLILIPFEVPDELMEQWTQANYLSGALPVITNDLILPDGLQNVAYAGVNFTVSGGTGPYAWEAAGGPAGLTIDPSTGAFTGTPTDFGNFTVVVTVTDNLGVSTVVEFSLFIDAAFDACIPQALGSLLTGDFSHNSRVGPHENGSDERLDGIFLDPDDHTKLLAQWSENYGFSWTIVRTASLPNGINSHDTHIITGADTVHVWTQESTGRVAYHQFNLATGVWDLENEEVLASANILVGAVSGGVRSDGSPFVGYESDYELVSASNRNRMSYKYRTGVGTWSAALPVGDIGQAQSDLFGRFIAGLDNRVHIMSAVSPGYFVASTPDLQHQVIKSDGTLSSINVYNFTGLLGNIPSFYIGDYCTYQDGSDFIIAIPFKDGGSPTIDLFIDSDTPNSVYDEQVLNNFVGETATTMIPFAIRRAQGQIHSVDWAWPSIPSDSWLRYKSGNPPTVPFTPANMDNQCGPNMGSIGTTTQQADATIATRSCEDVEGLYVATFAALGTVDSVPSTVKFEWIKVDQLPTDPAVTLATWLADLPDQDVVLCCDEPPPPPSEPTCVHALHRTDEYAGQSFSAGWAQTPAVPYSYSVSVTPPVQLQLIPAPAASGTLDLCTVDDGPALPLDPAAPVVLGIPDDLCWGVKWGTLAQLLNSDGDVRDPVRAKYCQDLYDLAVSLGRAPVTTLMVQVEDVEVPVASIADLDQYNPEWQCTNGRPSQSAMVGANLLVLAGDRWNSATGIPDGVYGITLDLARSFPVPDKSDPTNSYLQIGQELLNAVLDLAQHICSFKMAGQEFMNTVELRNNFLRTCGLLNARLRSNAFYNLLLSQPAGRQDFKVPKFNPKDPDTPGSGGGGN